MQFSKKFILTLFCLLLPLTVRAAYFFGYPIYPYIGADYQFRETPFHSGQGDNIFDSQFQQGNLYLGVRFLDYFGLEVSYAKSTIKNEFAHLGTNNVALGFLIAPGMSETHLSQSEYKTYTANVMGFYLVPFDKRCRTELVGSVGISRILPSLKDELTHVNTVPLAVPGVFTFDKKRTVLRLMGGVQYKISHSVGIRASLTFEDTSQYSDFQSNEASNRFVGMKGTFLWGLGLYFTTSKG